MKDTGKGFHHIVFEETEKQVFPLKLDNGEFDDMKNELKRLRHLFNSDEFLIVTSKAENCEKNVHNKDTPLLNEDTPLLNEDRQIPYFVNTKRNTANKHKNIRIKRKTDCCYCTIA